MKRTRVPPSPVATIDDIASAIKRKHAETDEKSGAEEVQCYLAFGSSIVTIDPVNAMCLGHFRTMKEETTESLSVVYTLGEIASDATRNHIQVLANASTATFNILLDIVDGPSEELWPDDHHPHLADVAVALSYMMADDIIMCRFYQGLLRYISNMVETRATSVLTVLATQRMYDIFEVFFLWYRGSPSITTSAAHYGPSCTLPDFPFVFPDLEALVGRERHGVAFGAHVTPNTLVPVTTHVLSAVLGDTAAAVMELLVRNDRLVLAGGAALRACDPRCLHLPSSDIDLFWIGATPSTWADALAPGTFLAFVDALHSLGYMFATSSQSTVMNAIGPYGSPRVQLVASAETSLVDLLSNFDFRLLQCAFDGKEMWQTYGCAQDILTHVATPNITTTHARIKKIQLKGYLLPKELQTMLDHAEPMNTEKMINDFPCVVQGVSPKYMEVLLGKFGLSPCSTEPTEWSFLPRKQDSGYNGHPGDSGYNGHHGILWNQHLTASSRDRFLDSLHIVPRTAEYDDAYWMQSAYELRLPLGCLPFCPADIRLDGHVGGWSRMKLHLNQCSDYDRWLSIEDIIIERFRDAIVTDLIQCNSGEVLTNVRRFKTYSVNRRNSIYRKYRDIRVYINRHTRWFYNGQRKPLASIVFNTYTQAECIVVPCRIDMEAEVFYRLCDVIITMTTQPLYQSTRNYHHDDPTTLSVDPDYHHDDPTTLSVDPDYHHDDPTTLSVDP